MRRQPESTPLYSSAASEGYKRQTLDGADLAVAYRNQGESPSTIALARIRSMDGSLRDLAQLGFAGPGGRIGIEAREGRYGIGWSDDLPSGAVTRLGVAICR